jgi:hypothetical protein
MIARGLLASVALCAFAAHAGAQSSTVWKVDTLRAKAQGAHTALLTISARQPVDGWVGGFIPSLTVKCADHTRSVFMVTGLPAKPERGKDRHFSVFYRLDDGRRIDEVWGQGVESDTLVASDPSAFAQKLLKAKRVRIGFVPDQSTTMIFEFSLAGLDKAMAKASEACTASQ